MVISGGLFCALNNFASAPLMSQMLHLILIHSLQHVLEQPTMGKSTFPDARAFAQKMIYPVNPMVKQPNLFSVKVINNQ
ncbi:hypothetical protein ACYCS5_29320 [Paenibacillus sp. SEL3]